MSEPETAMAGTASNAAMNSIPKNIYSTVHVNYASFGLPPPGGGFPLPGGGPSGHGGPGNAAMSSLAGPSRASDASVNVHVHVDLSNVMSQPAASQALARHTQKAILEFASANAGSFLTLPGRGH